MAGVSRPTGQDLELDENRVASIARQMRQLEEELNLRFLERSALIRQMMLALLMREHVLVTGPKGTAKSLLTRTVLSAIEDARVFSAGLNRFANDSILFGVPNVKQLRDEGVIRYQRSEGILDAHLAELDEFLDGSPSLLRTLLGILNERRFERGGQAEAAELLTAVATTNGSIEDAVKRAPELEAVIDRFVFRCEVKPLVSDEAKRAMLANSLQPAPVQTTISLDDLAYISSLAVEGQVVLEPNFVDVYMDVIAAWKKQQSSVMQMSDRTMVKAMRVVTANALLNGRMMVDLEDILAVDAAVCLGGEPKQQADFARLARPIIDKAQTTAPKVVDATEKALMLRMAKELKNMEIPADDPAALVQMYRELNKMRVQAVQIETSLDSTKTQKGKLLKAIEAMIVDVRKAIEGAS